MSSSKNPFVDPVANSQRAVKAWKTTSLVLAGLCAFLVYSIVDLAKNTPTALVPYGFATSTETAKVAAGSDLSGTSSDYVATLAIADLNLILNFTPDDVDVQVNRFLKRLTPELRGTQEGTLYTMASDAKATGLSQAYYPLETKISKDKTTVEVTGTQIGYSGGKEVSHNVVHYIIKYKTYKGYFHVADLRPKNS